MLQFFVRGIDILGLGELTASKFLKSLGESNTSQWDVVMVDDSLLLESTLHLRGKTFVSEAKKNVYEADIKRAQSRRTDG